MEIYFDNAATTRTFPEVVDVMTKVYLEDYGNPSSKHQKGLDAEHIIKDAKEIISDVLKCSPKEIIFTSGGTESDDTAIIGACAAMKRNGKHIITSSIEHHAVLGPCEYMKEQGYRVTYLPVDKYGQVSLEELENAICEDTVIVSIMHTNNEIGSVEPLEKIGKIIKKKNPKTLFHVDAVQGFGKFKIVPKKLGIDLLSVSGHKIHGPKGIGFLYINEKVRVNPYIIGGGQQNGMRSGTENVPGIAGLGKATELMYRNLSQDADKMYDLKAEMIMGISEIDDAIINGIHEMPYVDDSGIAHMTDEEKKLSAPHLVSASFKGVRSEVLLHALEEKGIYVSSGSACASNRNTVSETLTGIGIPKEYMDSTIRISFSVFSTSEEVKYTIEALKEIIPELRKYRRH